KFPAPRLGYQINALGGPTREDDFICARRTDVFCNAPPCLFVSFCRARAQSVQPTMDICILMLVKIPKCLDHRARFLGGCGVIEIDQGMAMRLFAQKREILANGLPVHNAGSNFVHTIICLARRCAPLLIKDGSYFTSVLRSLLRRR